MSKPKSYPAEGVVELPAPILLRSPFLGLTRSAVIGGVEVHVALPDFDRAGGKAVLHRRSRVDWVTSLRHRPGEDDPERPFGGAHGWGEEREFTATRLLLLPKGKLTQREAKDLAVGAEGWVELLHLWLEVIGRADLYQGLVDYEEHGGAALVWLGRGRRPGKVFRGRHELTLKFGPRLVITPSQWRKMLAKASEDVRPPEAHVFLRDARHARTLGHHRRAVLDAATAAEIALAEIRDDAVRAAGPDVAAYIEKNVTQIDRIASFLRSIGVRLPENITEYIAKPRNAAIHKGHEPDEEPVDRALRKAEEVLDLAYPVDRLL